MNLNSIKVISNEFINTLYASNLSEIICINDRTADLVKLLNDGIPVCEIIEKYDLQGSDIRSDIESLENTLNRPENLISLKVKKPRSAGRITLHVANTCNLRCKYCYASGGTYNAPTGILTKEMADNFIDFCFDNFDHIKIIVFFGGEPFMNFDIMHYICEIFENKYKEGVITYIPKFGVITNGTILNDEIINFINKYIHVITVSIDGPQYINDTNRVYKNGRGSFDNIYKFIKTVKEKCNTLLSYEATFTQQHIEQKYKHSDITRELWNMFEINGDVLNELTVTESTNKPFEYYYENIENIDYSDMPIDFWNILNTIAAKRIHEICPVYNNIFSVSIAGEIYPCHMLTGNSKVSLGNITDSNVFNTPTLYHDFLSKDLSKTNSSCSSCWANKLCGGCAIKRFYNPDKKDFNHQPNNDYCELTRKHLEQLLLLIAYIRKNPIAWNNLLIYKKNQ